MFRKAGPGDVSVTPIAIFSNPSDPGAIVGWYTSGASTGGSAAVVSKTQLYTVPLGRCAGRSTRAPSAAPLLTPARPRSAFIPPGPAQAKPGPSYSEDFRNTFIAADKQRMFTAYPLKNADGSVVPNAYVVGNEEGVQQRLAGTRCFIVRNVIPLTSAVDHHAAGARRAGE